MMLKKFIFIMSMAAMTLTASGQKAITLEDVIPGGKNYASWLPANRPGLQWWGDRCVEVSAKKIDAVDAKGKTHAFVTLEEVSAAVRAVRPDLKVERLAGVEAMDTEGTTFRFVVASQVWTYDTKRKVATYLYEMDPQAANMDFCQANGATAYTVGSQLYISTPAYSCTLISPVKEEAGVVYGQSVHRNEFGITKGTFWSPKGNALAFYRMDQHEVTNYPQVNTTTRIATMEPDPYPMAGMTSHKVTVGVYHMDSRKIVYLQAGDPTDRYFTNVSWSPDEKSIYLIELNRGQDHAQLVRYDATDGRRVGVIYEEKHPKYVEPQQPLLFLPWNSNQFLYQSQRDGYNHLYLFDLSKKGDAEWQNADDGATYKEYVKVKSLMKGDWLVTDVLGFQVKRQSVFYTSSEDAPIHNTIYELNLKTGKKQRIGMKHGWHSASLNQSGTWLIDNVSDSGSESRIINLSSTDGKKEVRILTADYPLVKEFKMPEILLGEIKAADGTTDLYYRLIKPVDFDPNKKYPAIIYVYGGPHAQMIRSVPLFGARGWDLYMASRGYVMLTIDNRGSANRGLRFENVIHRHLGVEEMKDQMKGVDLLKSLPYVDANRIGVHGWSFGGFMTTNLMLTHPDVFKVGVAGGPVIDWKYYEIMYGERYMDRPSENPEGYKGSDLKQKAGQLKGRLMVVIGGTDPTCVPQHSYTFLRACIDAGTHPDFFVYPEDGHNMFGRDRVHLHEQITRYFDDFLK